MIPNEKQNWHYTDWYDNPYFEAYEKIKAINNYTTNGSLSFKYEILPWLKLQMRTGGVYSSNNTVTRSSVGTISKNRGGCLMVRSQYSSLIGYTDPDLEFGVANTFKYKDFTLTLNFDGRIGGKSWANTEFYMYETGSHPDTDNQWRYDEVVNGKKNYVAEGVKVVSGEVTYDQYGRITSDTRVFEKNDIETPYTAFYEYRRTGVPEFPINPKSNRNTPTDKMPLRWMYPSDELDYNMDNVSQAIASQYGGSDDYMGVMWILK